MLHLKEHTKNLENVTYFQELVSEYYPLRLRELENLHGNMMVMDEGARVPQLFLEKLIDEINTLWRAEKHYWHTDNQQHSSTDVLTKIKFPKDYIVKKQKTISDLITHLHGLLFATSNATTNRQDVLGVLSEYIEIEYKLSAILIEKERRIHQNTDSETSIS